MVTEGWGQLRERAVGLFRRQGRSEVVGPVLVAGRQRNHFGSGADG
ncbi:hypothetical protein AB0O91_17045 [Kitasatospora sp. NPDC089797]